MQQGGTVNNPRKLNLTPIFDYIKKSLAPLPSKAEAIAKEAEKNNFRVNPNAYTGNIPA